MQSFAIAEFRQSGAQNSAVGPPTGREDSPFKAGRACAKAGPCARMYAAERPAGRALANANNDAGDPFKRTKLKRRRRTP